MEVKLTMGRKKKKIQTELEGANGGHEACSLRVAEGHVST